MDHPFTRFDPARDMHARETRLVHHHASLHAPIVIDAREARVSPRAFLRSGYQRTRGSTLKEYFPGGNVEMGDSDRGHLD
ncbi:MAG: hypothetical protein R3F17_16625 [Planctomycetota bacterium]